MADGKHEESGLEIEMDLNRVSNAYIVISSSEEMELQGHIKRKWIECQIASYLGYGKNSKTYISLIKKNEETIGSEKIIRPANEKKAIKWVLENSQRAETKNLSHWKS